MINLSTNVKCHTNSYLHPVATFLGPSVQYNAMKSNCWHRVKVRVGLLLRSVKCVVHKWKVQHILNLNIMHYTTNNNLNAKHLINFEQKNAYIIDFMMQNCVKSVQVYLIKWTPSEYLYCSSQLNSSYTLKHHQWDSQRWTEFVHCMV